VAVVRRTICLLLSAFFSVTVLVGCASDDGSPDNPQNTPITGSDGDRGDKPGGVPGGSNPEGEGTGTGRGY
jgi:hypothetical protein